VERPFEAGGAKKGRIAAIGMHPHGVDIEAAKARLVDYYAMVATGRAVDICVAFWELAEQWPFSGLLGDEPVAARVYAWRELERARLLPPVAATFLVISNVEGETLGRMERLPPAVALKARMRKIEAAAGFDDSDDDDGDAFVDWGERHAPPEYHRLGRCLDELEEQLVAAIFREVGEPGLAEMFAKRRNEFDALREQGRVFFMLDLDGEP
jgi:hypothetical protein